MGRKKQGNGRDSRPKRRGVKTFDGSTVKPGAIIVRQKGSRIYPGRGTGMGSDYTIYATSGGAVAFTRRKGKNVVEVLSAAPVAGPAQ